jgi:hypothetical protein
MSKYKSYCIPSDFLDYIQSVNNTLIIVNSGPSTVKTGRWLSIFQTAKNIEYFILFPYRKLSVCLTLKNFLSKVENLLLKIGNEYKIYQPKAVIFMHYNIFIRYRWCTYSEFLSIYGDNPRLNDFLVQNTLPYLYNINFSAVRVKYF